MSNIESNELPRRPNKSHVWGEHDKTIFLMEGKHGHQFIVEKIDDGIYELTICVYSEKYADNPTQAKSPIQKRTEYVLHTTSAQLRILDKMIKEAVNL